MTQDSGDRWAAADAYDAYMGRWSRCVAREFLDWLDAGRAGHWLEVGCGTGALTAGICERCAPASIVACDQSASFIDYVESNLVDRRVSYVVAGADALPSRPGGFDVIVSGLVLNFIPYWRPFLGGTGPAPSYVAWLPQPQRELLAQRLSERLPRPKDGSIRLNARALALRGVRR